MKNTTNRNFKNRLLLSFKDEAVTNLFYKSIYSFSQILVASLMTYCLVNTNLILMYAIDENKSKTSIKQLQIIILILEGILIASFIIWKLKADGQKKNEIFFWINFTLSTMNLFNICFQPLIFRNALEQIASSFVLNFIIPDIQFALIFLYVFFIDSNFFMYLLDVILSIVLVYSLNILENSTENIYQPVVISLGGIFFIMVAYFVNKRDKNNFILYNNAIIEVEKKESLFDHLNSGLITMDKNGCDYNLKIKEYLNVSSQRQVLNSSMVDQNFTINKSENNNYDTYYKFNNKVNENFEIKSLLFGNYKEYNPSLDKNVKEIFDRSLKFCINEDNDEKEMQYDGMRNDLLKMMRTMEIYQSYFYVGDKLLSKPTRRGSNILNDSSITLRIYMRYNKVSSSLEFSFHDISAVIEVENIKASYKYKKLFLNKFSHEFKNPLLNIMQLVSDLKTRKKLCHENSYNHSILPDNNFDNLAKNLNDSKSFILNSSQTDQYIDIIESEDDMNKDIKEIRYIKNSIMHLISLIEDFDFISNSELRLPNSDNAINKNDANLHLKSSIGQSFIEISKFRLTKIIKQCVSILQTRIDLSEKNIKVTTWIDENIPYEIYSDYRRLKQVISNLLSNAFKFTMMGEISITVTKDSLDDNLINFEICDTGMGFRQDILEMIQEGNTHLLFGNINSGGNIYGCGIGLELVENIISRIGKNFKITPQTDEGSKITFSLLDCAENRIEEINFLNNLISVRSSHRSKTSVKTENSKLPISSSSAVVFEEKRLIKRSISFSSYRYISLSKTIKKSNFKDEVLKEKSQNLVRCKLNSCKSLPTFKIFNESQHIMLNFDKESSIQNLNISADYKIKIINRKEVTDKEAESNNSHENDKTVVIDQMLRIHRGNKFEFYPEKEIELRKESSKTNKYKQIQKKSESEKCLSLESEKKREHNHPIKRNNSKFSNNKNSKNENLIKIRILLVDDEKFIRQSESNQIKKFFKSKPNYQYEIIECSDGVECLYMIYKGIQEGIKYDYIITDESMNFMRGSVMIKALNSLFDDKIMYRLNIFMVTSYEPSAVINMHGNICNGIISKPLTYENLTKIFSL